MAGVAKNEAGIDEAVAVVEEVTPGIEEGVAEAVAVIEEGVVVVKGDVAGIEEGVAAVEEEVAGIEEGVVVVEKHPACWWRSIQHESKKVWLL